MSRRIDIFSLLVLVCIVLFFFASMEKDDGFLPLAAFETKTIRLGKAPFTVFIADTPQKRAQGLMNVRELPSDRGMLFVFDKPQRVSFYNKNTFIPLDLVWVKDGVVGETAFLPAVNSADVRFLWSREPVDSVIELNAGIVKRKNIKQGDRVEFQ